MKSRADVLQSIRAKIRLLHLAYSTEVAYCGWVGRYYHFCLKLNKAWAPERKAEAFLTNLAVNGGVAGPDAKSGALGAPFPVRQGHRQATGKYRCHAGEAANATSKAIILSDVTVAHK